MRIYKPAIPLLSLFFFASISGQTVSLSGSGSGYQKAELGIYSQTDPVTKRLKPLLRITCNERGTFSCEIPCTGSGIIFIKTGIYNLHLYVTEGSAYKLLFPDYIAKSLSEEQNPFFIETEIIPHVINNEQDINNLIKIFDSEYNPVFNLVAERVFRNYKKEEIQQEISKLDKFSEAKEPLFYTDYVKCRMVMLNLVSSSANQVQTIAAEFINKGFKSGNQAYSDLAEQMFSEYFTQISSGPLKDSFNRAVATASYTDLRSVIMRDGKIINKELADFVALLNMNTDYYERNLPGENVRKIISLMRSQGETVFIKKIASAVLEKINLSLPGNIPPDFALSNSDGKLISLKDFKGKYLLLGFVRSDNPASLRELGIISMWQNKYVNDVQIAAVLTDRDFKSALTKFKNTGSDWNLLDGSKRDNLEFLYDIKMYPSFLLLDREGKIIANPSPFPSENIELNIKKILLAEPARSGIENR